MRVIATAIAVAAFIAGPATAMPSSGQLARSVDSELRAQGIANVDVQSLSTLELTQIYLLLQNENVAQGSRRFITRSQIDRFGH